MGDFLSLLGAAFDSFFDFIMWRIVYWDLLKGEFFSGPLRFINAVFHAITMIFSLFLLGPGLYAAADAIATEYAGATRPAFTCKNLSI